MNHSDAERGFVLGVLPWFGLMLALGLCAVGRQNLTSLASQTAAGPEIGPTSQMAPDQPNRLESNQQPLIPGRQFATGDVVN